MNNKHSVCIELKRDSWLFCSARGDQSVKGYAYCGSILLDGADLMEYLYQECLKGELSSSLKNLSGNFAAIIQCNDETYIIEDKLRSYPLFYLKSTAGVWTVSDNIEDVLSLESTIDIDIVREAELVALGYLQSGCTLLNHCFTVGAGSFAVINPSKSIAQVIEYHEFPLISDSDLISFESIKIQAKEKLREAFHKMILTIKDRPIAIPLSGGYDSRLIACLCKEFNLKNVICFTYGIKGSPEVRMSEKVAKTLGFPWYYVEYTSESNKSFLLSDKYAEFSLFAMNLNARPHVQDFIAIEQLIKDGVLNSNFVILPGHSGDLLGGSHLSLSKFKKYGLLSELIFSQYYIDSELIDSYKDKILDRFPEKYKVCCGRDVDTIACLHQNWNIKTRQSNYIINSVRVYEYFGMDWRIPLWDDDFAEFWLKIKSSFKIETKVYNKFMFDCYFKPHKVDFIQFKRAAIPLPVTLKRTFKNLFLLIPFIRKYLDTNAITMSFDDFGIEMPPFLKSKNMSVMALHSLWLLCRFRSYKNGSKIV